MTTSFAILLVAAVLAVRMLIGMAAEHGARYRRDREAAIEAVERARLEAEAAAEAEAQPEVDGIEGDQRIAA